MFNSPYNFVPAAPFVLSPEWASQASHDHPFADGLCGELAIELSNETPLCVGGRQEEATGQAAGRVHFYRTPDNILAIPGSSLKGMLRNALAPVVFARMGQVEERKLSVRDISATGTYYHRNIVQQKSGAGWLRFHEGQWQIRRCSHVRIHQKDIIEHLQLEENDWKKADTVKKRYKLLKGVRQLKFDQELGKNLIIRAVNLGQGKTTGSLVVTGQPGAVFDRGRSAKKWEFVFYAAQDEWVSVPQQVMRDFMFVHENSEEWDFLRRQGHGQGEIPVFFHGNVSNLTSMGLASMYRLAQQNSLHDALRNISGQHLDASKADLTDLLFGRLQPEEAGGGHDWGLRGRVNIGLLQARDNPRTSWTIDTVLSSPKPSFHPAYLQQQEGSYTTLDSKEPKLQGWKRYPVKPENVQAPPRMEDEREISNKVKVRLETVENGSVFSGKIRFHNLRPVELGALLWIIDFGGYHELRHALGTGKPYGLGQVELKLCTGQSQVIPNDRTALQDMPTDKLLQACKQIFVSYMDGVWQTAASTTDKNRLWENSPQVENLRKMADPQEGMRCDDSLVYLVGPKPFLEVKNKKDYLQGYTEHEEAVWADAVADGIVADSTQTVTQVLERVAAAEKEQEEKRKLAELRESMSAGDRIISEIAEEVAGVSELNKTLTNRLRKAINGIAELGQEELPDRPTAEELFQRLEGFGKEGLNKTVAKIRSLLADS